MHPAIAATVDADALVGLARANAWRSAAVGGPFDFDNAFPADAACTKRIGSAVVGETDRMPMSNRNAGSVSYESCSDVGDCAGQALSARVPAALRSHAA